MVKLMEGKDNNEEEEKLLPEEFKRWQEREPGRRQEARPRTQGQDAGQDRVVIKGTTVVGNWSEVYWSKRSACDQRSNLGRPHFLVSKTCKINPYCLDTKPPTCCCSSLAREEEVLGQMQDRIREKLEIAKKKSVENEQKQNEILKKVELENTVELNKIKTLLGEQREVGGEWEKELAILKFKFSCKLDNIQHNNSKMEEEIRKLEVELHNVYFAWGANINYEISEFPLKNLQLQRGRSRWSSV